MGLSTTAVADLEGGGTTNSHLLCFQRGGKTQFMLELKPEDSQHEKLKTLRRDKIASF